MRIRRRSDRRASWTRRAGVVVVVGVLAALSPMLHPEPVSAASGVDDYPTRLRNAPQDSLVDPWRFYNRECTSFVAWRLNSENLVDFDDFWRGAHWGNASNWKNAARSLSIPVDNNPTRGAVAWWAAGSAGSSRGHVAWVQTVGDGAITIEEYNYLHAGRYDTRTISSSSSLWPSGFIHIQDTQIRSTAAPQVTGKAQVGVRMTTSKGTWSATNLDFTYQWLANGAPIKGATANHFKPTAAQVGKLIRAKVTATKAGAHSGTATSAATGSVAKGVFVRTTEPVVAGAAQVGVQLSGTGPRIKPATSLRYQWTADGVAIQGATGATFTPTAGQLDSVLRLRVIARAAGYKTMHTRSDPTDAVSPGAFEAQTPPTIAGVAQVDQPLTASPGVWKPAGRVAFQWLADGAPIEGATGSAYTPSPEVMRQQISVQVRVRQRGYADALATSAPTDAVAPGTFLNTVPPSVTGTPQVGVALTAKKGAFTPRATAAYQWTVDGVEIAGATHRTFTPRPQDLGKHVAVEILASRPGYLTAVVSSPQTAAVAPGVIHNTAVPEISGQAINGHTLTATHGTWSINPDAVHLQWFTGPSPIAGATSSTYVVTAADAGRRIHVVATAVSAGYHNAQATSASTDPVVLGTVSFDQPLITGQHVVGRTLHARVPNLAPTGATAHYHWLRDGAPIHGAREATYVVQPADLGHRLRVEVRATAKNWVSRAQGSDVVDDIRTTPSLHASTSVRGARVELTVKVTAPGLASPDGVVRVWRGTTWVGRFDVVDGVGSGLLHHLPKGQRTLKVVYRGELQVTTTTKVPVTAP